MTTPDAIALAKEYVSDRYYEGTAAMTMAHALLEAHRELEEMRAARDELADLAEEGWSYATDYFREKWLDPNRIAALRAIGGGEP